MSAENDAAGVRSNLIPREGGNTFKGVRSPAPTPTEHFNSDNVADELPAPACRPTRSMQHLGFQSVGRRPAGQGQAVVLSVLSRMGHADDPCRHARPPIPNADPAALFYTPDLVAARVRSHVAPDASKPLDLAGVAAEQGSTASYDYQDHEYRVQHRLRRQRARGAVVVSRDARSTGAGDLELAGDQPLLARGRRDTRGQRLLQDYRSRRSCRASRRSPSCRPTSPIARTRRRPTDTIAAATTTIARRCRT